MPARFRFICSRAALLVCLWSLPTGGCARAADHPAIAKAAAEAIDQRLSGKPPGPATFNLWNPTDFENGITFAWNPGLWCADWQPYFTCFSPFNSNDHAYQAGTLITSKHVLFAEHFSGASGSHPFHARDTLVFMTRGRAVFKEALVGPPLRVGSSDLCIGTLEHDLPPSVVPAQVLPPGLPADFLPPGTPVLFANKNKELRVAEVASFGQQAIMAARAPLRAPWTLPGPAAVGDSGCPVFILLNGRPVLWWLFHFTNAGESISMNISVINRMLGRGYQLDVAKVEGF